MRLAESIGAFRHCWHHALRGRNKSHPLSGWLFTVESIRDIIKHKELLTNETDIFIGENGVRTTNNANEIAHYEYGAALASDSMLDAMNLLEEGVSEMELGAMLTQSGQHTSVVTIAASGQRFIKGNMFPTANKVKVGDTIS